MYFSTHLGLCICIIMYFSFPLAPLYSLSVSLCISPLDSTLYLYPHPLAPMYLYHYMFLLPLAPFIYITMCFSSPLRPASISLCVSHMCFSSPIASTLYLYPHSPCPPSVSISLCISHLPLPPHYIYIPVHLPVCIYITVCFSSPLAPSFNITMYFSSPLAPPLYLYPHSLVSCICITMHFLLGVINHNTLCLTLSISSMFDETASRFSLLPYCLRSKGVRVGIR